MASENPNQRTSLYPEVDTSNPDASSAFSSSSSQSNLYPEIDLSDLNDNLFPENTTNVVSPSAPPEATEEILITVPGAILHLIDKKYSVELACGDFTVHRLRQDENVVAVYARVADEIQWPLAKDETSVKVDDSHYFFSFRAPKEEEGSSDSSDEEGEDRPVLLNYGLTIASKGQEDLLKEIDDILKECSSFSVQEVSEEAKKKGEALDGSVAMEISPVDLESETQKELMEEMCSAYWTTLAPNVEEYSGTAARLIATGSGHVIKGILWCGDVTVDRLKWGNEFLKKRMTTSSQKEISPETLKRIKRCVVQC